MGENLTETVEARCTCCGTVWIPASDGRCGVCARDGMPQIPTRPLQAAIPERGAREQGTLCENCQKPVEVGQVVLPWDDVGEMHADCEHPFSLKCERHEGEPEPVVLLGEPMMHVPLAALSSRPNVEEMPTDKQVREAMQTAWDDFCGDAQAHPDDIYRAGRETFFRAGTWADHTAMNLRAALRGSGQ